MNKADILDVLSEVSQIFDKYEVLTPNMFDLIKTLGKLKNNPQMENRILPLRIAIWSDICSFLIDSIEQSIIDLFESFADVSEKNKRFIVLKKEYEEIDSEMPATNKQKNEELLERLKQNYTKLSKLTEEIDGEEDSLRFQGQKQYLTKVYSWIATVVSSGYIAIVALNFSSFEVLVAPVCPKNYALLIAAVVWIVLLIVSYPLGKRFLRMNKKNKRGQKSTK